MGGLSARYGLPAMAATGALSQMSARFAKGEGSLVALVRERQDLIGADRSAALCLSGPRPVGYSPLSTVSAALFICARCWGVFRPRCSSAQEAYSRTEDLRAAFRAPIETGRARSLHLHRRNTPGSNLSPLELSGRACR